MVQACAVLALAGVSGAQYFDPYTSWYAVPLQYSAGYAMPSQYTAAYPMPSPFVQYAAPYVTPTTGIDFSMWPQYDPNTGFTYTYRDLGLNYQENNAPESQETAPAPEAEERAQQQPEQHQQQPEQPQQQAEKRYEVPPTESQYAEPQYMKPQYAEPQYAEPQYADPQYAEPQYAEAQAVAPSEGQVP